MTIYQNPSLIEVAETIADNKFVLGDALVQVGISAPNLESSLASIAMAQAELGHARLLYRWADDLVGTKREVQSQTGKAFSEVVGISNWISLIANVYVVNLSVDLVMRAMLDHQNPNINPPFAKMLKEQHEHLVYSRNWCRLLLEDEGGVPRAFLKALDEACVEVEAWLQKVANDSLLISESIILEKNQIVSGFVNEINSLKVNGSVSYV